MNSLIWRGVDSTTIKGLLICELPPITKPGMRVKETTIDGRDGSIIEELGYEPYDKNVVIGLHGNFDINEVIKYFTGEGDIVFSNEPDKVYKAKIIGQVDYTRLLRYRQATIPFRVQPYKYNLNESFYAPTKKTAASGNLVLTDVGNAMMTIDTNADIIVHGKNLFNANGLALGNNTELSIKENGYVIHVKGGAGKPFANSIYNLPLEMAGKTYYFKLESLTSTQNASACAQIAITSPTEGHVYVNINNETKVQVFTVPADANKIQVLIVTNNTSNAIATDNEVEVHGLMLTPPECKNDDWCAFEGLQKIRVDGLTEVVCYTPVTVVSNMDCTRMTAEYYTPFYVTNKGLEVSKPLFRLYGTGGETITISVNGNECFQYTFPQGDFYVDVDSEIEDAYVKTELRNRSMNGEFPLLQPGDNRVTWSGFKGLMTIWPRSRWL